MEIVLLFPVAARSEAAICLLCRVGPRGSSRMVIPAHKMIQNIITDGALQKRDTKRFFCFAGIFFPEY